MRKHYTLNKPEAGNYPVGKERKRWLVFSVLLLCLLTGLPQKAQANIFSDWNPEYLVTENWYGYIQFKIPIYEDENEQTWATGDSNGWAFISNGTDRILEFMVDDNVGEKDGLETITFKVKGTNAGQGRIRVSNNSTWTLIENVGSEITMRSTTSYDSEKNCRVGYIVLRYYPPTLNSYNFMVWAYVKRTTIEDPGSKTYNFPNSYNLTKVAYSGTPEFSSEWSFNNTTAKQVSLTAKMNKGTQSVNTHALKYIQWDGESTYETLSYSGNNASSTRTATLADANKNTHSTKKVTFYWRQDIPDTYSPLTYETYSGNVVIPAYNQANNISGSYSQATGTITLNWTINTASHSNSSYFASQANGGDFEIQRATNSSFNQNVTDLGTVTFQANKSSYSITDVIPDLSNNGTFYYRIRRTKPTNWSGTNWDNNFYSTGSIGNITVAQHATVSNPTLEANTELGEAVISWETVSGYWSPGSQLIIEKYNQTTKSSASSIVLNEEDYNKKKYADKSLSTCNEYSYTIYVKPGVTFFPTQTTISIPGTVVISDIGKISGFKASKGYHADRTNLEWTAIGSFDEFIIKRVEYGENTPVQIATVPATLSENYTYDDVRGIAGIYYKYIITGVTSCNNKELQTSAIEDIGFRMPTGNIYGRVTFSSGQPVKDVEVSLSSDLGLGYSINLKNNIILSVPKPKEISNDNFTFQTWFMSESTTKPGNQLLFFRDGQYEVGFNASGELYFKAGSEETSSPYDYKVGKFMHVSAVKQGQTLQLYLDGALIKEEEKGIITPSAASATFYLGSNGSGKRFVGYLDEVRIWNRALEKEEIERDYTRLIVGNETDLMSYYRFDEMMGHEFYDISYVRTKYNENHGTITNTYPDLRTSLIPEKLGLKGITDSSGDYYINGIPYEGNGTQYKVIPSKGTHQFDPNYRLRNLSDNELTVEANFTNMSSFNVSGTIKYENTNIPVQGVGFKIDGIYVSDGKGGMAQTNADGDFTIEVPVGVHTVEAVKDGHVFNDNGKFLRNKEDIDYQDHMVDIDIWDQTKIRFIGRVAGGSVQESHKVGHSLSKNNLGDNLMIKLRPTKEGVIFNSLAERRDVVHHIVPSNKTGTPSAKTEVVYKKDAIYIYPDKTTGEFYADLIPYEFALDSISATGHKNDILKRVPGVAPKLDLQNSIIEQEEVYEYIDSIDDGKGGYNYYEYSDTVKFHYKTQYIKRVPMEIDFYQLAKNGTRAKYFGEEEIEFTNLFGDSYTVPVYLDENYLFSNGGKSIPLYLQGHQYNYVAVASEVYRYNGSDATTPDRVPCIDGSLIIENRLAEGSADANIKLNSDGYAVYSFIAGVPDMGSTATKTFNARIRLSNNEQDSWKFEGDETMNACIIGSRSKGSDFVTQGPYQLITVLRDPPGSNSYAYLEKGTVFTSSTSSKHGVSTTGEEDIRAVLSPEFKSATGTPFFMMITEIKMDNNLGAVVSHEESSYDGLTKTKKTTLQTRFETSSDPLYVGRDGDILIGNSTNIVYGVCDSYIIVEAPYDLEASEKLIFDGGSHKLIRRSSYNSETQFHTLFAHPQVHIENRLIPELIDFKKSILKYGAEWTPENAQQYANQNNEAVYVSYLSPRDDNFGLSNNDEEAFSNANIIAIKADGPSYRIFYPESMPMSQRTDTIFQLCSSINNWYNLLAQNEKSKLNAKKLHKNYSFHAGSLIEYSEEYAYETETTYEYEYFVGASAVLELGATFDGIGFKTTFTEGGGKHKAISTSDIEEYTRKEGFVLAEEGDDDYLSVDVYYEETENLYEDDGTGISEFAKGPFVYRTRGGVTSCPYEDVRLTKYYQPGSILDQATVKLEVPVLSANQSAIYNVPQTRPAVFKLYLENQSEAKEDNYFTLAVLDGTNPYGAKLSIDGQALSNTGRAFLVPYGEPVEKTLEFRVGADSMKYEKVQLILRSQCQYDPTNFVDNIADTISLSAYFIPSCSDINIKSPLDNFIVNTKSTKVDDIYQLPVILNGYDVNNQSLDRIEIQMKQEDESEWLIMQTYFSDPTKINNPLTEAEFDRTKSEIEYNLPMTGYDSRYQIRAVSICVDGSDEIPTYSQIITGTKDAERPKLFGSPQPANGILDVEGEIRIDFNESIKEGSLSSYNFQVTGIKNGSNKTHGTSVEFDGINDYLATEAERNFINRDLTLEMWVYREKGSGAGTLFSHGNINKSMEFGFTADDKLIVQMNGNNAISGELPFETGTQWAHVAMVYNSTKGTVSLFYNAVNVLSNSTVGKYEGNGIFEFGRSIKTSSDYFGGKMHEVRLWNKQLSTGDLRINWLKMYSGLESGMVAYYPMTEGKGKTVYDKVRGANATIYAEWSTQEGRAIAFDGEGVLIIPSVEISKEMDYTLELWFKAEEGQADAAIITNELQQLDTSITLSNTNRFFLGFDEDGKLIFRSNEREEIIEDTQRTDYRDNNWHHVAISVNRVTRRVEIFMNGLLIKQFSIDDVEGISADRISMGAVRVYEGMAFVKTEKHFKGSIDEVRFWNSALTEDLVNSNNNNRLKGDEMGLVAYYPFEEYKIVNGISTINYILKNIVPSDDQTEAPSASNITEATNTAPIKDRGPVENLAYSFVISDKSLIINLDENMDVIEKSTVTFSVKEVLDMFGNETISPIIWSAYIDRNLLKWSTDEVNLSKERNGTLAFEVDITNNGGVIERFSLENLPAWLTASPMNGNISPKSKQTIRFTVKEGLNVGRYQETVFMRNSKNVVEMLGVNLRIKGEKPNWSVNPADFEYNMDVFGKLRINGLFSSDEEDMLAAFINGRCIGVTTNSYQEATNTWYTFLTVYGNKDMAGAEVEFRIWDASTGIMYGAETTQNIVFRNQQISGSPENPLIFDTSELVFQNIKLNKGWNWISFHVSNNSLNNVQSTLSNGSWSSSDIIKNDNYFDSYSVASKTWAGTLSSNGGFNNTSMFMLNTANNQTLSIIGRSVDVTNTPIAIKGNKWNLISYLPEVNMTLNEALADYDAKSGDVIKSQSAFAMFDGYTWIGSLTYMEPSKGYMLLRNDNSDASFKYPVQTSPLSRSGSESQMDVEANHQYANNMTMTAIVDGNTDLRSGDRVVALINGEVRGATTMNDGLNYLNIASDNEGVVEFAIERDGQIIAHANTKQNYAVNRVAGNLKNPVVLDFSELNNSVSVYPNPFVTDLTIRVTLEETSDVKIAITDISGQLVTQWPVQKMEAGIHTITWEEGIADTQYIVTVTINGKPSSHKIIKK